MERNRIITDVVAPALLTAQSLEQVAHATGMRLDVAAVGHWQARSWPVLFPSTSGPWRGIGGSAMTTFQITVLEDGRRALLFADIDLFAVHTSLDEHARERILTGRVDFDRMVQHGWVIAERHRPAQGSQPPVDAPHVVLAKFLDARFDEEEHAMRWASNRGRWEAHRDYRAGERGQIRHKPTGDRLGEMLHPADAEHAVRWQPIRVAVELQGKRTMLAQASRKQPGEDGFALAQVAMRTMAWPYKDHPDYDDTWSNL